jgi:parvulin-like peptidyl-prolyl isomerase
MLLAAEADKRLGDEEKKVVQEELDEQARRIVAQIGSRAQFARELRQEGTDLTTWTEDMKRALMIEAFIHRRFASRVDVDGRTMLKFYREHRDRWRKKERVRMQVIAAPFDSFLDPRKAQDELMRREAVAKAHEQIVQAKADLDKGEGFDAVAKKYDRGPMASQGGLWPLMERGSFRSGQVEDVAFKQGVGGVSEIIETSQGYYIVKTIQIEPASEESFEKVQGEIEAELRKAQYQALTSDYLKELQGKTRIFVPPGVEKLAVDAAVRLYWVSPENRQ